MKKISFNSMQEINDNFLLNIRMKQQIHLLLLFVKEENNTVSYMLFSIELMIF